MKQTQKVVAIVSIGISFFMASCNVAQQQTAVFLITPTATKSTIAENSLDLKLDEVELELPREVPGYGAYIMDVSLSPDDSVIAGGVCYSVSSNTGDEKCDFGNINIWDSVTGKRIAEAAPVHLDPVGVVSYSPDGKWIASTMVREPDSAEVVFWDSRDFTELFSFSIPQFNKLYGKLEFSKDGKFLAFSSNASSRVGRVIIWNIATKEPIFQLAPNDFSIMDTSFHYPILAGFLCMDFDENCEVAFWNIENSHKIFSISLKNKYFHPHVPGIEFNNTGNLVAFTKDSSKIVILDTTSFQQRSILENSACSDFSFSSDGKFLFAVSVSQNKPLSILNLATNEIMSSLGENPEIYLSMFHHSNSFVAPNDKDGSESIFRFSHP